MTRLLCWLTGHRLTVVVLGVTKIHHCTAEIGPQVGRCCHCGHRHTVTMSDGTEREA
jgi:hypothetical protein